MANAAKDENGVSTITAVNKDNGSSIVRLAATSNSLVVSNGTTGSDYGPKNALRDENDVPTTMAVSSHDGQTIVPLYADSLGRLLIQST
jgi:hypothetical protein